MYVPFPIISGNSGLADIQGYEARMAGWGGRLGEEMKKDVMDEARVKFLIGMMKGEWELLRKFEEWERRRRERAEEGSWRVEGVEDGWGGLLGVCLGA